jgi:hypothetical protein
LDPAASESTSSFGSPWDKPLEIRIHSTHASVISAINSCLIFFGLVAAAAAVGIGADIAAPIAFLPLVAAFVRAARIDFRISNDGVVVRNFWTTGSAAWSEIDVILAGAVVYHLAPCVALIVVRGEKRRLLRAEASILAGRRAEREALFEILQERARAHGISFEIALDESGMWRETEP